MPMIDANGIPTGSVNGLTRASDAKDAVVGTPKPRSNSEARRYRFLLGLHNLLLVLGHGILPEAADQHDRLVGSSDKLKIAAEFNVAS